MFLMGALLVLAAAPGASAAAGMRAPGRPTEECTALVVSSPQATARNNPYFSATRILDLRFTSRMRRRLTGEHLLEFKVYTPRGHLYQTLAAPFTGTARARRNRGLDGRAYVVPEQRQAPAREGRQRVYEVSATLPVGGTAIMANSLYGGWRVEAFLDGSLQPCGTGARFEIQP